MKAKQKTDIIIALTVVACSLVLAGIMVFRIGKFSWGKTEKIQAVFNFVNGLDAGAPVRFGGALVGKVERVEVLDSAEKARLGHTQNILVTASLNKPVEITEGSEVTVNTMGFIGEKYIEIRPGPPGSAPFKGGVLVGNDPAQMERVLAQGQKLVDELLVTAQQLNNLTGQIDRRLPGLADKMDHTLDSAQRAMDLIGSPETKDRIEETLNNVKVITTYGKIFFSTIAQKPWRLFWGGKVPKLPTEKEILSNKPPAGVEPAPRVKPAARNDESSAAEPVAEALPEDASLASADPAPLPATALAEAELPPGDPWPSPGKPFTSKGP